MRMTLAKWTRSAAIIATATLAATGCSEGGTWPGAARPTIARTGASPDRILAMREKYGAIGRYHNEGLAFVYDRLKMANARSLSRQARCTLAEKAARDFHVSVKRLKLPPGVPADGLIPVICAARTGPAASRNVMIGRNPDQRRRTDLSPAAIAYIDQIELLMNDAQSIDELKAGASQIESGAVATLNDTEAGEIVGIVSVLTSSADYWTASYDAWESDIGTGLPALYAIGRSSGAGNFSIQTTPVGLRYGISFRDALRIVRADVWGAIRSPNSPVAYCTVLACTAYDSFVASMREAIAPM